jgi:type VI secretion system protein ImpH
MATASRRPGTSIIDLLRSEPERFELVQAVRLFERAASIAARDRRFVAPGHLGFDHDPRTEVVSLRAALELAFPVSEIASFDDSAARPELTVTMLGLNGVSGVLPSFYSQMVLESNRDKNRAPRDFFDILNHRSLSLFVRAAQKYRLPLAYELGQGDESNTFIAALLAVIGIGLPSLQQRQPVPDDALLFYSGHFGRNLPTAGALQQILSEYFDRPVTVRQFQGRWISWPESEQTRLSSYQGPGTSTGFGAATSLGATAGLGTTAGLGATAGPGTSTGFGAATGLGATAGLGTTAGLGATAAPGPATSAYATLGTDAVIGSRVWDVQGSFRLLIGPLSYEHFRGFLPDGEQMRELAALARSYVGPVLNFNVQLILTGPEVPPMQLSAAPEAQAGSRLGWDTWLPTNGERPDASDAVFEVEAI